LSRGLFARSFLTFLWQPLKVLRNIQNGTISDLEMTSEIFDQLCREILYLFKLLLDVLVTNFLGKHKTSAYQVNYTQQHNYIFPKNFTPWWDSNPRLMFMRWTQCPLSHGSRAS
jgi:hypothetical protein